MNQEVMVSVICMAFNHELYIRETLDSFLMQQTSFPFEILIHDDASTDGTPEIIREYEEKYPDKVKPIYQTENQYSQKINATTVYQIPRARGKYIALCEGDDFWTDPLKLQKQVDALEAHPEVDMCAHAAVRIKADTREFDKDIAPRQTDGIIPVEEVILGEGGFVATNSIMYRKEIYADRPRFYRNFSYDYGLQIFGSLRGGLLYLADSMAVYRFMSVGSWSSAYSSNRERRENMLQRKQCMLDELDEDTNGQYHDTIQFRKLQNEFEFYYGEKEFKAAFDKKYMSVYRRSGIVGELKYRIKAEVPAMNGITQQFKRMQRRSRQK